MTLAEFVTAAYLIAGQRIDVRGADYSQLKFITFKDFSSPVGPVELGEYYGYYVDIISADRDGFFIIIKEEE